MEKIVERNILFDFYGELLTQKQRSVYEDAVYGDMSLSELADNYGISRQGAHDFLKRCDKILLNYENKLHLIEKSNNIKNSADEIKNIIKDISGKKADGANHIDSNTKRLINKQLDIISENI